MILLLFVFLIGESQPPYFVAHKCNDSSYIGDFCNITLKPCDSLKPCQNMGNCTDDHNVPHVYSCTCTPGFNGTNCQFAIGPCQLNTCLQKGASLFSLSLYFKNKYSSI
jgi:hypothetical protein